MRRTIEKLVFKKVFLCAFCDWTPVLGGARSLSEPRKNLKVPSLNSHPGGRTHGTVTENFKWPKLKALI